ncbi:MAG: HAMP domain-containing histidine kinase [Myxococcales bacterium]|nr:HAMP domain-containing histidine kinase [Myxococcales bacterium]
MTLVLAGGGWLVVQALAGVEASEAERHRQVAERVFDEVERELSALIEREEARSFLEYRYFYVPQDNADEANPAVVQSPLSRPSDDPTVVGWWSLEPDGSLRTPDEPRDNEVGLACDQGWSASDVDVDAATEIRGLVARLPPASMEAPARPVEQQEVQQAGLLLNRAVQQRQQRTNKFVPTKLGNLDAYRNVDQALLEPQADAARDVAVEVRPLQGYRVGDRLVLHRLVVGDGESWRQGLVLRIPELEEHLASTVLGGSELEPYVTLSWDGGSETTRRWRVQHRFAEPFQGMSVVAAVDRVPALVGSSGATIRWMAGALVVLVVGGGLLIAHTVRTELEFAQRRSDFVAAVSHELKTPLTTIRMYAEMLRDGMVPSPERQQWYHQTITSESDRLGRLIGNVLELARLERGGPEPELVVGEADALLQEALQVVRPHASSAGFTIEVEAPPGLPPVRVDRDGLVQVVVNLVDNAVKFAAEGNRVVRCSLARRDGAVVLTVRDHGPGVPQRQMGKVFEPFYRGERELVRRTRGTGIGLALVQGLMERMGGSVQARNHPGGGFEVALLLPVAST